MRQRAASTLDEHLLAICRCNSAGSSENCAIGTASCVPVSLWIHHGLASIIMGHLFELTFVCDLASARSPSFGLFIS